MRLAKWVAGVALVGAWGVGEAGAATITSLVQMPARPQKLADFSQFAGSLTGLGGSLDVGPANESPINWTASGPGAMYGNGTFKFLPKGSWDSGMQGYVAALAGSGGWHTMTFEFARHPVAAVGVFLQYKDGGHVVMEALDQSLNVLESFDVTTAAPITATGTNSGAFRGFVRDEDEIYALRIRQDSAVLVDQLVLARIVPVPAAAWAGLALLAGVGMGRVLRRKKA